MELDREKINNILRDCDRERTAMNQYLDTIETTECGNTYWWAWFIGGAIIMWCVENQGALYGNFIKYFQ